MLINVSEGEECRIALLDDGKLEELYMERTSSTSHVGNIYKGRVTNVEPSIQAAFVDFGLGRNGFLHISDLMPTYFGRKGEDIVETVGKKMARRDRPPIQRCLRRGDDIVVQIIKEGIGTKGPTLSTYLSIPGRILVMMPGMSSKGVSRKIEDDDERRRLRQILDQLEPPEDCGFIIRTAGIGKSKAEIERDLKYLARLWETIKKQRDTDQAPVELYTEGDLVTRTVRDLFSADVERIVIDSKDVARRVKEVIKLSNPRTKNKVDVYEDSIPLFHKYGIEREIELMYSRHVPLPSGGSLVIDSTEAIVAIDVNSGKFRDHSDAETTAFKTDLEAADEIARQLRLRDLGGVIICDFIDLRYERHRRELEQRLHDHLKRDRAKTKMLRMSQFGIIEMTRQRMRPSLKRSVYFDCPHCKGAGLVKTPESMSLDVMRRLAIAVSDQRVHRVELAISPDVGMYLLNKKRADLTRLEAEAKKRIVVRQDTSLALDEIKLDLFDMREGLVILDELAALMSSPPHRTQLGARPHGQQGRGGDGRGGRFDGRRQAAEQRRPPAGRDRGRGRPQPDEDELPDAEERYEMASADFDDRDERDVQEAAPGREPDSERDAEGEDVGDEAAARNERGAPADRGNRDDRGNRGGQPDRGSQHDRGGQRGDRGRHEDRGDRGDRGAQHGDRRDRGGNRDNRDRRDQPNRQGDNRGSDNRGNDRAGVPGGHRGGQAQPQPLEARGPSQGNGDPVGAGAPGSDGQGEGGRRRRRRRRGRRGRGRGRNGDGNDNGVQGHGQAHDAGPAAEGGDESRGDAGDTGYDAPDDRRAGYGEAADWEAAPSGSQRDDDRSDSDAGREVASHGNADDRDADTDADAGVTHASDVADDDRASPFQDRVEPSPQGATAPTPAEVRADNETPAEAPAVEEPAPEGRGRRGRRGGRGRSGRKHAAAEPVAKASAPAETESAAEEPAPDEAKPKRRRGGAKSQGKGGGGGGRAGGGTAKGRRGKKSTPAESADASDAAASEPRPQAGATGGTAPVAGATGAEAAGGGPQSRRPESTDRHLMRNEIEEQPVMHEPVRRPRSPRDLDHIPEDYD